MKKTIITLATVALAASGAQARSLSPAEALGRALASPDAPAAVGAMRAPARVLPKLTLNLTASEAPALYVISRGENQGFVIVSADDVAAPLLGYSDEAVDFDNLPENFKWWLSQYQGEISAAVAADADTYTDAAAAGRDNIAPLVTTRWNQDSPYNDLCPTLGSTRCPAGCVATAMAQVINYHKYPEKGIGSHRYRWNGQNLSFDFANTTFEWDKMLDSYAGGAGTAEQRNAVATLLYGCGVSVDMGYKAESSGAFSYNVPMALREYFGFDQGVHYENRLVYTSQQWEDMVYDQIKNVGPVYYSGRGESGGHAFVCDGYMDGLFHFNWGWGGMSDGYFRLNALVPGSQGIGGNSDGFNTDQAIIAGIQKPQEGSQLAPPSIVCSTLLSCSVVGNTLTLTSSFISFSSYSVTGRIGLELRYAETGEKFMTVNSTSNFTMAPGSGYTNIKISTGLIPDGHFYGYPVFTMNGVSTPIKLYAMNKGYLDIVKEGGKLTAQNVPVGNITYGQMEFLSPFYTNKLFAVNIPYTFTSETDVLFPVIPQLIDASGNVVALGERLNAILTPGDGVIEYAGSWVNSNGTAATVTAGSYKLQFCTLSTDGYEVIAGPVNIEVERLSGTTVIRVNSGDWSIDNSESVPMDDINIKANVFCFSGYYAGAITAKIFEHGDASNPLSSFSSSNIFMTGGERKDVTLHGEMLNGIPGNTYDVYLYNGTTRLTSVSKSFVLGANSGIGSVIASDAEVPVLYYNLQGQPVENPAPGTVVIRRQGDKAEKILVR